MQYLHCVNIVCFYRIYLYFFIFAVFINSSFLILSLVRIFHIQLHWINSLYIKSKIFALTQVYQSVLMNQSVKTEVVLHMLFQNILLWIFQEKDYL